MSQNHSPEPWRRQQMYVGQFEESGKSCERTMIVSAATYPASSWVCSQMPIDDNDTDRILACVNAMAGVSDPEHLMQHVRDAATAFVAEVRGTSSRDTADLMYLLLDNLTTAMEPDDA